MYDIASHYKHYYTLSITEVVMVLGGRRINHVAIVFLIPTQR